MKLWIGIHHHRHGVDVHPLSSDNEEEYIGQLDFDEEEEEWVEIRGPWEYPPCD